MRLPVVGPSGGRSRTIADDRATPDRPHASAELDLPWMPSTTVDGRCGRSFPYSAGLGISIRLRGDPPGDAPPSPAPSLKEKTPSPGGADQPSAPSADS